MGWLSDLVSDPISTVTGTVNKVISNPIPAITAAVTQNPAALLAYGAPQPSGMTQPQAQNYYAGGTNLLGGVLQNRTNQAAAQQTANALRQAGTQAQGMAQFRPVGVTTTFGTSNYQVNPQTGQLESANYSLSPMLQEYQNSIMGANRQSLSDAAALQNLGRQYVAQSPQEAAQNWLQSQRALLAPSREQAWANLSNQDYNRGTTGLKVAQGTGLQMSSPYASALANAQSLQDLQLAAQAEQQGRAATTFGQGLLSSAYDPFSAGLKTATGVEALGQQPFTMGLDLAKAQSAANYPAAALGLKGNVAAAETLFPAMQQNPYASALQSPGFATGLGQWMSGGLGGSVPSWTTGSDVMPDSTFSGYGDVTDLAQYGVF